MGSTRVSELFACELNRHYISPSQTDNRKGEGARESETRTETGC